MMSVFQYRAAPVMSNNSHKSWVEHYVAKKFNFCIYLFILGGHNFTLEFWKLFSLELLCRLIQLIP